MHRVRKKGLVCMKKIRLVQILWVVFCVGLGFVWASLQVYFVPVIFPTSESSPISKYAGDPGGFLFFTSEDIIKNATANFHIMIDQLDMHSNSAHVNIEIDFLRSMAHQNTSNSAFFGLQVLNPISDANVTINGEKPENYGTRNNNIQWSETHSTSYLIIEFPEARLNGQIRVALEFTWSGLFWQRSFYEYEIVFPFNNGFPSYIHQVGLPEEAINENGKLLPAETAQTLLSVAKPETSIISNTMPNSDAITFSTRRVWYFWDIRNKNNPTLYASTVITMDMETNDNKIQYEQALAFFPLFVGIGIPMMVSSATELVRLRLNEQNGANVKQRGPAANESHKGLLLGLSLVLVISLGLNISQISCVFKIDRTPDSTATFWLSIGGICLGAIFCSLRSRIERDKPECSELTRNILISLAMKDQKDALNATLKDYEITNKELERRENINLLVGTILVTASLIILGNTVSASSPTKFPYAFSSVLLFVLWLFVLHYTTAKLDAMTYPRMRAIEEAMTQHFGYAFGVHLYTYGQMENNGGTFRWVEVRRQFWGIILIALSTFWLVISLLS